MWHLVLRGFELVHSKKTMSVASTINHSSIRSFFIIVVGNIYVSSLIRVSQGINIEQYAWQSFITYVIITSSIAIYFWTILRHCTIKTSYHDISVWKLSWVLSTCFRISWALLRPTLNRQNMLLHDTVHLTASRCINQDPGYSLGLTLGVCISLITVSGDPCPP